MKTIALLWTLAMLGCAQAGATRPLAYTVFVSPELVTRTNGLAVSAVLAWSDRIPALSLNVIVGACPDGRWPTDLCVVYEDVPADRSWCQADRGCIGTTSNGVSTIFANAFSPGDSAALWLITHEIGHGLGLPHNGEGHIMSPGYPTASPVITDADIASFWESY